MRGKQPRIEKHVIATNKETKKEMKFTSMKLAAEYLNINYQTFRKIAHKGRPHKLLDKYTFQVIDID